MESIVHFFKAGGIVMYPLLALSISAVVVIVERLLAFREMGHLAPGLLDKTVKLCEQGRYDEALTGCEKTRGPLAASLATILRHRSRPIREVERLVEETGQSYFIRLERFLPVLDTTTTISPLLGLLGTIIGMIGTFNAIAVQQNRGNSDSVLAGVGEALYATASGILIAVICFIAYNYFAARVRTVTSESEQAATRLINVLTDLRHHDHSADRSTNHAPARATEEALLGVQAKARA